MKKFIQPKWVENARKASIWLPESSSRVFLTEQALLDNCFVTDDNQIIAEETNRPLDVNDERYQRIVGLAERAAVGGPYLRKEIGD